MELSIDSVGDVGSRVVIAGHALNFDQPAGVPGGQDRGASPLDVFAAAAGGCAHYYAAAYLFGRGLPTEGLRVRLTYEKSRERPARLARLALVVELPAGTDSKHREGILRAIHNCPVLGSLVQGPELTVGFDQDAARAP